MLWKRKWRPWYHRKYHVVDLYGPVSEVEKTELDRMRKEGENTEGRYEDAPYHVQQYVFQLETEIYEFRRREILLLLISVSYICIAGILTKYFNIISYHDDFDALFGPLIGTFLNKYFVYILFVYFLIGTWARNWPRLTYLRDAYRAPNRTNEAMRAKWEREEMKEWVSHGFRGRR